MSLEQNETRRVAPKPTVKFDAYIRVSATRGREDKDNFFSPEQQLEKIENYAKLKGYEIVQVWRELDQSGRKEKRPMFQEAIARVERKETDGIIVAKLDRFARSVMGAKKAIKRIEDADGKLIAVDNNFDTTTPFGKFGLTMMMAIAELESDRIKENWADVQERVVMGRGVHISSRAPTGYARCKDDNGVTQPLVLDPKAAKAVREVFRARASTPGRRGGKQGSQSLRDLAQILNDADVRGPYNNNQWTSAAVTKMLQNRVYLGEARSGRYVKPKAHPAIITQVEWDAAQAARVLPTAHKNGEGALLSGLLRCAGCRYLMKPDSMTDRNGDKLRLYRCRGEHAAGFCSSRASVLGRVIEPYVVQWLFDAVGSGGILARPIRAVATPEVIEEIELRKLEAEAELTYWLDRQSARKIGLERYNRGLYAREEILVALELELAETQEPAEAEGLQDVLSLESFWPELSIKKQRYYLSLAIDVMMLRCGRKRTIDQRAHIFLKGEAPNDLPRRGYRQDGIRPFSWPDGGEILPRKAVA
jgi:site-specific DNA recombinase